jgi:hypothetical protein
MGVKFMSDLIEIFKNKIPTGKYQTSAKNGEESGLLIDLESNDYLVKIDFGVVSAFRMLDEGIVLGEIFGEKETATHAEDNFSNTIYQVQNGEFSNFIKMTSNELYDYLNLKHYVILTMNYVIEVISKWEPSIEVNKK